MEEKEFLDDVKNHKMTIEADDGNGNRRIYFGRDNSFCMHFRIVTFADYLVYTGDMGTYVFRRLSDMFNFFRGDGINPQYWSEKLEACDGSGGYLTFDYDHAIKRLNDHMRDYCGLGKDEIFDVLEEFEYINQDEWDFISTARSSSKIPQSYWDDFSDRDIKIYDSRYLWCCHAIVWAIKQYDNA